MATLHHSVGSRGKTVAPPGYLHYNPIKSSAFQSQEGNKGVIALGGPYIYPGMILTLQAFERVSETPEDSLDHTLRTTTEDKREKTRVPSWLHGAEPSNYPTPYP